MESFLNPSQVLNEIELSSSMIAADFGSGSGGWAIPLAKILKDGRVFAIDILKEPLSALEGKAKFDRIFNIKVICSDIEEEKGSKLGDNSVDLVLMTNLLFQSEKKQNIVLEAKRVLRGQGKVLVVDWLKNSSIGPREGIVSSEEVKKIFQDNSFSFEKEFRAGSNHFGMIFIK